MILSCDSPIEPVRGNFRIELYSYKAGTENTPCPNILFTFRISITGDDYLLENKTDAQGRYTILIADPKYEYHNYQLNFGQVNYGVIKFGEVHRYYAYN